MCFWVNSCILRDVTLHLNPNVFHWTAHYNELFIWWMKSNLFRKKISKLFCKFTWSFKGQISFLFFFLYWSSWRNVISLMQFINIHKTKQLRIEKKKKAFTKDLALIVKAMASFLTFRSCFFSYFKGRIRYLILILRNSLKSFSIAADTRF